MLRSITTPELALWAAFEEIEPAGLADALLSSFGKRQPAEQEVTEPSEETPEQIEARIMREMGLS